MTGIELHRMTDGDAETLVGFIRDTIKRTGCDGVVVGLSGGIDSATVTKLCVDALGADKVLNVFMPTLVTSPDDYKDTTDLSSMWGTTYKIVDIQPAVDAFTAMLFSKDESPLEGGNISARCRMTVLYNLAKKRNSLVVGTSNKSELLMGYFTKFGDGAADMVPMIDLYKTQVWELASVIGVPQNIIDKVPTAGLWEGQTDEIEMGISYHDLDLVLNGISASMSDDEISDIVEVPLDKVREIRNRMSDMEHKRMQAYCLEKTFNV